MIARGWAVAVISVACVSCAKADREPAPTTKAPTVAEQKPVSPPARTEPSLPKAESAKPATAADEAKKSADAPSSTRYQEPKTLAEAQAALADAKKDLDQLLGAAKGRGGKAAALSTGDVRCGKACKAFASLRRAADAVCRLAGDSDARCAKARDLVKENEGRVEACHCSPDDD